MENKDTLNLITFYKIEKSNVVDVKIWRKTQIFIQWNPPTGIFVENVYVLIVRWLHYGTYFIELDYNKNIL